MCGCGAPARATSRFHGRPPNGRTIRPVALSRRPETIASNDAEQLIADHYDLALGQAANFGHRFKAGHLQDELESAALFGLFKASRAELRTAKFSTLAYRCIHNEMLAVLRKKAAQERNHAAYAYDFAQQYGLEGCEVIDGDTGEVTVDVASTSRPTSEDHVLARDLAVLVDGLPAVEREYIRHYFYEDQSAQAFGPAIGLTNKTAFFRTHHSAIDRLRLALSKRRVGRHPKRRSINVRPGQPGRPMITEPTLTRSSLLALRASLEQQFEQSIRDIDAALRVLDVMAATMPTPAPQPPAPGVRSEPRRQRKPQESNLGPRFEEALARMPARFTKKNLVAAVEESIGREISPGSVPFCMERLVMSGKMRLVTRGGPGRAAIYERAESAGEAVDEEQDEAA